VRNLASIALVRKVRKSLEQSQEEFARNLKVSKGAVQHWESGRSRPSPRLLKQMISLAPPFAGDLRLAIEQFEWHTGARRASRYSEETRHALISALDMILDNAPSTVVETVSELLTKYAGQHGDSLRRRRRASSGSETARVK
jgi:transcriptional regulator with XRE-family HTH domain